MILRDIIKELGIQKQTFSDTLGLTRQGLLLKLDSDDVENAWGFKDKQITIIKSIFQVNDLHLITPEFIGANKNDIKQRIKVFRKIVDIEKNLDIFKLDMNKTNLFYNISNRIKKILEEEDYFIEYSNVDAINTLNELLLSLRAGFGETKYLIDFIGKSFLVLDRDLYPQRDEEKNNFKYFEANLFKVFENYRNKNLAYSENDISDFMLLIEQNKEYEEKLKMARKETSDIIEHILTRDDLTETEKNRMIKIELEKMKSHENDDI